MTDLEAVLRNYYAEPTSANASEAISALRVALSQERHGKKDDAWCDGFVHGCIAMGCLLTGHGDWEEMRDEYLAKRA